MEAIVIEWLSLVFRWLHVITAVAWIGASFYFIWLDNSLEQPPQWKKDKGVKGDLWAFHGGGIYEVGKYQLAPPEMPKTLHWFKWEAYSTWITGTVLMIIIYYWQAQLYLAKPDGPIQSVPGLIGASILFVVSGFAIYQLLFKLFATRQVRLFAVLICGFIVFYCWLATFLFSGRAAFLHLGAFIATIMAANVFFGIIPAQKGFIRALDKGETPNEAAMLRARLRSVHNNYFTLPVLFCMISNHSAFLYGHPYNWVVLAAIMGIAAYARHFFNLRHKGIFKPHILAVSVAGIVALAFVMVLLKQNASQNLESGAPGNEPKHDTETINAIVSTHCAGCHSSSPTLMGFTEAPAGLMFESIDDLQRSKDTALTAISTNYMPLGNITGMNEEERQILVNLLQ